MLPSQKSEYVFKKEYLPGYTGFVPKKNDLFGMTAGDINKKIVHGATYSADLQFPLGSTHSMRFQDPMVTPVNRMPKDIYGNWSRYAKNWISGPNHEVLYQHIPGYTGHVSGIASENIFGKSYPKCSATAIGKRHPKGYDVQPKVRYVSQNRAEFNEKNFRRIVDNPSLKPRKDYDDYTKYINEEMSLKKNNLVANTLGSSGNELQTLRTGSVNFKPAASSSLQVSGNFRRSMQDGFSTPINDIKPRLLESKVSEQKDFFKLSDGFQKIFANDRKDKNLVLPIAGYGGHRRGDRSQNYFGKSFRETTIQSKKLERNLRKGDIDGGVTK